MKLKLADNLTLPAEAATQTFLVVGKRGSGKSTTCVRLAEQLIKADVPIVAIDPVDRWWGLKASRDGRGPGLSVYVFGGEHADLPLEASAGTVIADTLIEHRFSAVLSVKHLSGRERGQFVSDLAGRLFQRNKEPLHVFLEEAHEVAPQQPFKGEEEMLGRVTRLWKLGRSSGLGGSAITQRPASLSKNITTQAEILIVHRTIGPQDVAAVKEWIRYHGERDDILSELATLKTGECFVWAPDFPEGKPIGLKRVQILDRETFDSSATPKVGQRAAEPKELAPVDLDRLRTRMQATIEKAKAEDPRELRRELAAVRAELSKARANMPKAMPAKEKRVEIPVLKEGHVKRIEATIHAVEGVSERTLKALGEVVTAANEMLRAVQKVVAAPPDSTAAERTAPQRLFPRSIARIEQAKAMVTPSAPLKGGPQEKILGALNWWRGAGIDSPTRHQVAFVAGYTVNGHFNNTLGNMRTEGLIDYPGGSLVMLTPAGEKQAGPPPDRPSLAELVERVRAVLRDEPRRRVFDVLTQATDALSREDLAQAAGYTVNGHFNNVLGSLSSLGVAVYPRKGFVQLSPLFDALD